MNTSGRKDCIMIWRVLSCIAVFITHLGQRLPITGSIKVLSDYGKHGVYVFFIISGFLAFWTYSDDMSVIRYYIKRALRILPLYYLVIICYFIMESVLLKTAPPDEYGLGWFRYIFFLSGIVPAEEYFWYNLGMTWTLYSFVAFYLLMPILRKLIRSIRSAVVFSAICYVLFLAIFKYCNGWFSGFRYLYFFSIGIIIYFSLKQGYNNAVVFFMAAGALFFVVQKANFELILSMIFGIIFIVSWEYSIRTEALRKILSGLDKISYDIYLVQGLVFSYIIDVFVKSPILIVILSIILTIVLSELTHYITSIPAKLYGKKDR